ncbi:carbohydrate ABC transporter permease [Oceanobacillus neutriphilus]|uniref:Sugar ABC transporter permease n=1 Tax=Oceanobacillus neutriphilus TaxID=531815 RepID=A0ABQ2NTB7_9BACI|nr:carbohydrate ABC transporter permease [Oceanobacillus neutriphilus]GGP10010.1 sugar ABC transporter permease [Oceanobacillus neutriphilus]
MSKFSLSDKAFDRLNFLFVLLITIIIIYPLIFVISASISDPHAVNTGKMWLWPVDVTFEGFQRVFQNDAIWIGYKNTILYTVVGVIVHLFVLLPAAYALSRKELMGKKAWLWFILFTMLFNGGLIPTYLVVRNLQMLDTMWAIVIPGVVGAWSILVARTFFQQTIPDQLVEAAKIDGASDIYLFFKVVLPLSMPIIAVMALFHGVALWNQYFNALIYLRTEDKFPLQLILRQILILNEVSADSASSAAGSAQSFADQIKTASLVKYAVIIVSALPLLIVYPFLQRFFVKGVLIGSVKE